MELDTLKQALDFQQNYEEKVEEAVAYVSKRTGKRKPLFGIVLGSGLGELAEEIENPEIIDYSEIPNFPTPTVEGHEGKMYIGNLQGVEVIGLKGRKHYYEVADEPFNTGMLKVIFPVHVLASLGVKNYFATNAAGGLNLKYNVGDIMILESHLNWLPNASLGRHHEFERAKGGRVWRFEPMNKAYDPQLRKILKGSTNFYYDHNRCVHQGTYMAVTGPTYETEAECLAFRKLGADAVGMSTTPEVIAARSRGMKAVAMSCITNKIDEDGNNATNHEEVKAILESKEVKERLSSAVRNFFWVCRDHMHYLYK